MSGLIDKNKIINFVSKNPLVNIVREVALSKKSNVYVVGGFIRDLILENRSVDIDFAVESDAKGFVEGVFKRIQGKLIVLGKEPLVNYRLVHRGSILDFVEAAGHDIHIDLSKRDFTMNALALNLTSWELHDIFSGIKDIKAKIIREISPSSLRNDPVRIMRGARYISVMDGAKIEDGTICHMKEYSAGLSSSAPERVIDELKKMCAGRYVGKGISLLFEIKAFEHLISSYMKDKTEHTSSLEEAKRFYLSESIRSLVESRSSAVYRLLFCGETDKDADTEKIIIISSLFFLYKSVFDISEKELGNIIKKMRFSNHYHKRIVSICSWAMELKALAERGCDDDELRLFIGRHGEDSYLSFVILSACCAIAGLESARLKRIEESFLRLITNEGRVLLNPEKLISGDDIKKNYQVNAPAEIGEMLSRIRDLQFQGVIKTREEALSFIQEMGRSNN